MHPTTIYWMTFLLIHIHFSTQDIIYFGNCEKNQKGVMRVSANFGKFANGTDFVSVNLIVDEPISDNMKAVLEFETSPDGQKYRRLFVVREKKYCSSLNKNLGELLYTLQRAAKIPVGECPIRKGHYRLNNHPLNLGALKILNTLPKGYLKLTTHIYRTNGKEEIACTRAVINLE